MCNSICITNRIASYAYGLPVNNLTVRKLLGPAVQMAQHKRDEAIKSHRGRVAQGLVPMSEEYLAQIQEIYRQIKEGKSKIKIEGTLSYRNAVLDCIKTLLHRPLSRELIEACHTTKGPTDIPISFKENGKNHVLPVDHGLPLGIRALHFDPGYRPYYPLKNDQNEIFLGEYPPFIVLSHEMIHALHDEEQGSSREQASMKGFPNMEEQITITGRGRTLGAEKARFNEHDIAAIFGFAPRAGHKGSSVYSLGSPKSSERANRTKLHEAARLGAVVDVRKLLGSGQDPNAVDRLGNPVIMMAIEALYNPLAVVQSLCAPGSGIDLHRKNKQLESCLMVAAEIGNFDILDFLIPKAKTLIDDRDDGGFTVMHNAARSGNWTCMVLLMEIGKAGINTASKSGLTPLHIAENRDIVKLLLDERADINAKDCFGQTPAEVFAFRGRQDLVDYLTDSVAAAAISSTDSKSTS